MNKLFLSLAVLFAFALNANAKKVLDHSSFDDWKSVRVAQLSNDGQWAAYMVNPQEGDGMLTLRHTKNGKEMAIARGYNPKFTADSKWAVALIKPFYLDTRKAKINKKKDFDMPQDSLAIVNLTNGDIVKIAKVNSYKLGKDGGDWLAYLSCDTAYISPKALKDKKSGQPLIVRSLPDKTEKVVNWVKDYQLSKNGLRLAMNLKHHESDSTATDGMALMMLPDTSFTLVDKEKCFYGSPVFSEDASMMAFTASNDSADSGTKKAQLYLSKFTGNEISTELIDVVKTKRLGDMPHFRRPDIRDESKRDSIQAAFHKMLKNAAGDSLFINQYSLPLFSHNGKRLVIGVAPAIAPDDTTIVDFEQAELDIWRWDAPYTPPQDNKNIDNLRKTTLPVVIDLEKGTHTLMSANELEIVNAGNRWDSDWALIHDPSKHIISQQWDYAAPEDIYVMNVNTGVRKHITELPIESSEISPCGKYVFWFDKQKYYTYNIETEEIKCISDGVEFPLWDELQDIPLERMPYGAMGWLENDNAVLVYDRHDIWQLDPDAKSAPVNITKEEGRKTNCRYKYLRTDEEKRFFSSGDEVLLNLFDYTTKENGFAMIKIGNPAVPVTKELDKYKFTQVRRAKNAPVYAFQKANFNTSPDVYIATNDNFKKAAKVTDANPQMKDYNWGTAELVKWHTYNGDLSEGILYKPEDFDPQKKYPMLVVFYERDSENLYHHYTMEPSWSWVNYPFYVSRGYIVFVPDIHYTLGIPGECAYNYICSGVEDLCNKYEWIDKERIGIDGQSWGGYQTAFLITRTNMFRCAGSGAPVANMTSAFGGIRWESGSSRQAQYECGQSRIGRNLWEAPELYISNSPLFFLDRVNTPVLIMHNDQDGAVPWYQGIEMFMGLRRLQKPVWMLQYNGEAHNIRTRKNRKDITIRLQQFFDHYLKDAPMPEWMKNGIPALRKGQEMGTELCE